MDAVIDCILTLGNNLTSMKSRFLNTFQGNIVSWPEHLAALAGVRRAQVCVFVGVSAPESRRSSKRGPPQDEEEESQLPSCGQVSHISTVKPGSVMSSTL